MTRYTDTHRDVCMTGPGDTYAEGMVATVEYDFAGACLVNLRLGHLNLSRRQAVQAFTEASVAEWESLWTEQWNSFRAGLRDDMRYRERAETQGAA